jgi:phosphate-selective porin OprO/OprP
VRPATPYVRGAGGWGAFGIALRYGVLDVDDAAFPVFANPDAAVSEARNHGVALSWYPSANVRLVLDYNRTAFDGGAAAGDRDDEQALFTRVQIAF